MRDWQEQLSARWETIRAKGRVLGWHEADSPYIAELARRHGLEWYEKRSQDEVREFMPYDADGLFNGITGFGAKKCQKLIEILEAASSFVEATKIETESEASDTFVIDCAEVLQRWGVPFTYPLHLLPIGTRLMNFCEQQQVGTLLRLLEVWNDQGVVGMLAQDNIGRRTVDELESLARAVSKANAEAVRRWLPLNETEDGLCMRRALALSYESLPQQTLVALNNRLVDKLTLEESAVDYGITRERVRQYEAAYLRDIRAILDWYGHEQAWMLETWMEHGEWQTPVLPQASPEAEALILAGIDAVFVDTPQGLARRLAGETMKESWADQMWNHPDLHLGGVNLQVFLDDTVPEVEQPEFIASLTRERGLVLDYDQGLVKPAAPCVRDTACAILAQEEEPIPLTWLAMRVQAVEGCEEGDKDFILRNRYRWNQLGFLDLRRVLWHE
jgi:hypothetical protein